MKDIYNSPSRIRHYLLNKLENHKRKERVIIDEYTIEHILPQNPHLSEQWRDELGPTIWQETQKEYVHTIGNLTLTAYNSEMSDHPFHDKCDKMEVGLAYSPLHLNAGLGQVARWNAEAIELRAQRLVERAFQIWGLPELTTEQVNLVRATHTKSTTGRNTWAD